MASACTTVLGITGGSTVLPNPVACNRETLRIGTYRRMADGTLRYDYSASGYRWTLAWQLLDGTDRGTLQTEAIRTASMQFSPPTDASTTFWNVLSMAYTEDPIPSAGATIRWNCALTLETVD